jgi:hypothetical protein
MAGEGGAHPDPACCSFQQSAKEAVAVPKRKPKTKAQRDLEAWIYSDPTRVYYTAIRAAFIEKFAQWYNLPAKALIEREGASLEKKWRELIPMVSRSLPATSRHEWRTLPREPQVVRVLRNIWREGAGRKPRGRPLKLRGIAVEALDLQRQDPTIWTWRSITGHLCNCGLEAHGFTCQENLRREALLVKKFLRARQIRVPSRPAK